MLTFHVVTLFPEALDSYLRESIVGRAIKEKKIAVKFYNPRDFVVAKNKAGYKQTDDRPYGGGPGMVLMAEPILKAVAAARKKIRSAKDEVRLNVIEPARKIKTVLFSPAGKQFTNQVAIGWTKKYYDIILICGRYEGVDARVKKILKAEELSVGPYVLTGGELPALVVMDTAARQTKGVLGKLESLEERRLSTGEVYTRPEVLIYQGKKYRVPKVLLSGHSAKIEEWRRGRKNTKAPPDRLCG